MRYQRKLNWYLLGPTLILMGLSLFHLYALSGDDSLNYFYRQFTWIAAGLICLFIIYLLPTLIWPKLTYVAYGIIALLLMLVLIKAEPTYGAKRWLEIGWISFQPSEFAKIVLIGTLAKLTSTHKEINWKIIFLSLLMTSFLALLVVTQPDLGTGLILVSLWLVIIFVSGISLKKFLVIIGAMIAVFPLSYFFLLRPYQKLRILTFLNPQRDPLGAGWSSLQSKIALGSGRLFGKGIGGAAHTQLKYLPQPFTDFIFSSVGEAWGFVGTSIIIILYGLITIQGINLALKKGKSFGGIFAAGFTALIGLQGFINMGMASGMLPVTGVPLPLISYGGSSALLFLSGIGILLAFYREL